MDRVGFTILLESAGVQRLRAPHLKVKTFFIDMILSPIEAL